MNNYEAYFSTPERAALAIGEIIYCCTINKNCAGCPMEEVEWNEGADEYLQALVTPCAFPYNVMEWMESEVGE